MKRMLVGVVACALALSGCARTPDDVPVFTPTPIGAPSASPTPTQAELSAMAEATYRAFFAEWARLQRAGGADDPTPTLLAHGAEDYLDAVMDLLRDQKRTGKRVSGPIPNPRVEPAPGEIFDGIDPRLTLKVCEDSSAGTYTKDGIEQQGQIVEGVLYFRLFDNTPKVVAGTTKAVERCSF